jgi:hypothetical protein
MPEYRIFSVRVGGNVYELSAVRDGDGHTTVGGKLTLTACPVPVEFHERLFAAIDDMWDQFDSEWPRQVGIDMDANANGDWRWPS